MLMTPTDLRKQTRDSTMKARDIPLGGHFRIPPESAVAKQLNLSAPSPVFMRVMPDYCFPRQPTSQKPTACAFTGALCNEHVFAIDADQNSIALLPDHEVERVDGCFFFGIDLWALGEFSAAALIGAIDGECKARHCTPDQLVLQYAPDALFILSPKLPKRCAVN